MDHEIGSRLAGTRQLRPDAAIVRGERVIRQPRPVIANAPVERERAVSVDVVILALDPFHIRAKAHATGEIERHVHPESARHRHRINQPREHRPAGEAEIVALGEHEAWHPLGRVPFGRQRQALGAEPGAVDDRIEAQPLRLAAADRDVPTAARRRLKPLDRAC